MLEAEQKTIGIVTGIHGKLNLQITVRGVSNHAATTPKKMRRDALVEAVNIIHALNDAVWGADDEIRFTIGSLNVTPNQPYVIPGEVSFHVDIRHPDAERLRSVGEMVSRACRAASGPYDVTICELTNEPPLKFDASIRKNISNATNKLQLPATEMSSGAWHDSVFFRRSARLE